MASRHSRKLFACIHGLAAIAVCPLTARAALAQEFEVVSAFDRGPDGNEPSRLIQASDGSFYGTTVRGGVYSFGAIFHLDPDGTETILHSFKWDVDGERPSGLIQGTDGNFYGVAYQSAIVGGGSTGSIFRMFRDGAVTLLHTFACGADGAYPTGGLVQAADGNFYGTASGAYNDTCSVPPTVFRMTPEGAVSTVHAFVSGDGVGAGLGALIQASDGNLYGTTSLGGPLRGGTAFQVTLDGTLTVLHAFNYPSSGSDPGGSSPHALMQAADGNLYGTTSQGGACEFCGTVFRLSPAGDFQTLYAFQEGANTGSWPSSSLVQGTDLNFYGATSVSGAVFQMTADGEVTVLHQFDRSAGGQVSLQAADGSFYGLGNGGPATTGFVFQLTLDGAFNMVYWFPGNQNGTTPSTLVQALDGNVYGIAEAGGTYNRGTVFQLMPDGTTTALHAFTGGPDGGSPSTLIKADDGTLYGMTGSGGDNGVGTLFQIAGDGSFTVVYSFAGNPTNFASVSRGLVQASDGSIYGTTTRGGAYGNGAIFRVATDGTPTILYSFTGRGADGAQPVTLIQGADGNFYGTAVNGGTQGMGSAFRMTPDGTVDTLAEIPYGPMNIIQATDGNFYLPSGNDVFRMTADGVATGIHTFALSEGYGPSGLMQAVDGNIYGTCYGGPTGYEGSLFRMTLDGDVTVLHAFTRDVDGANPHAAPIQTTDGRLYGTTWNGGGPSKAGVVFRFTLP